MNTLTMKEYEKQNTQPQISKKDMIGYTDPVNYNGGWTPSPFFGFPIKLNIYISCSNT